MNQGMAARTEGVILDWAGTTVDFGSFAPTQIFVDAFQQAFSFTLSLEEARRPMGLGKWQHIEAIGRDPGVDARWQSRFGRSMSSTDVDFLYETFLPLQVERVGQHADLIPGTLDVIKQLRQRDIKIGSTTGYPRRVMEKLIVAAARNGYQPDAIVCSDDLAAGSRPGPWMALQCVQELKLGAVSHCIKVDDTLPGIAEGRNAGTWTVGLALSGSPAGLTLADYQSASADELDAIRQRVTREFREAGAHFVIDTIADLLSVIDAVDARIAGGERP